METKGKRVRRTAMLLLWSAICAAGGTAVGHGIAPTVLEETAGVSQYTLDLARTLEESMWKYESMNINFGDGVMAMTPIGGEAVMGSTDGVLDSGSLTVLKYAGGDPQSAAKFTVYREDGELCANLTTDSAGQAKLLLGAGSYRISEMATDADTVPAEDYEFTITKGQQLQLTLSSAKLGTLTINAAPGAAVDVYAGASPTGTAAFSGTVDEKGTLVTSGLAPGDYTVVCGDLEKRVYLFGGQTVYVYLQ